MVVAVTSSRPCHLSDTLESIQAPDQPKAYRPTIKILLPPLQGTSKRGLHVPRCPRTHSELRDLSIPRLVVLVGNETSHHNRIIIWSGHYLDEERESASLRM